MLRARLPLHLLCILFALCCLPCLQHASAEPDAIVRLTETHETSLNLSPSLSGDGTRVAFESTADLAAKNGRAGFHALLDDLTTAPFSFTEMSASRALTPSLTQDGSRVVFSSTGDPLGTNPDGNPEVFLYDKTDGLRQLTDTLPAEPSARLSDGSFNPSISDDGRLIAFSSNRDLLHTGLAQPLAVYLYDTTTQSFERITDADEQGLTMNPKLSGDGSHVLYLKSDVRDTGSGRELMLYDRLARTTRRIVRDLPGLSLATGRVISDDAARLVFSAETQTDGGAPASQVFIYDVTRDRLRQLTQLGTKTSDVALQPTISGDGKRLAFATRRSLPGIKSGGGAELYLFDIPTARFTKITNAPGTANAEVVSSLNDDGSLIAFNFPRILSAPVSANELANNSEIYLAHVSPRAAYASDLRISNAASLGNEPSATKSVAPGSIAVAYGSALAFDSTEAARDAHGDFPLSLGGTTVTVDGQPVRLFYVSPEQVNFQVPPQTITGPIEFVVTNSEGFQTRGTAEVTRSAPGIFTVAGDGRGPGIILDAESLQAGPFDPGSVERRLILFATGVRGGSQILCAINGTSVVVESVRESEGLPGLDEVHLLLPRELSGAGAVQLSLQADGRESNPVSLTLSGQPAPRDIIINELLADPPEGIVGDANLDGTRSASQDEFVELVNTTGHDLNLGGYKIVTRADAFAADKLRHAFTPETILPAGAALVVFGGANAATFNPHNPAFGGAQILTASTGGLSLINSGGIVMLLDSDGATLDQLSYGSQYNLRADLNQSLTRSPDINGRFTLHMTAAGGESFAFSPGTRVDGAPFRSSSTVARVEVSPATASITVGDTQLFAAHAFDLNGQEVSGIIFRWESSAPQAAAINQNGLASGLTEGSAAIRAVARGIVSPPAVLNIRPRERILTSITVTPSAAILYTGGTQQFKAVALDQDGKAMDGVTFNWSSNSTGVASVDENGLATATGSGSALVSAEVRGVRGNATLDVLAPPLIINEVLADPPDGASGDANHDGARSGTDDEFIELVNQTNEALDISGWTIRTRAFGSANEISRHTFAQGTTAPALDAMVIFGGGSFDADAPVFGGAQITRASSGGLSLSNNGLEIILRDAAGRLAARFSYGTPADDFGGDSVNQSITRFPDIYGPFVRHTATAAPKGLLFSPGTKTDSSFFAPRAGRLAKVKLTPQDASIFAGQSAEFTAQALDQFDRPLPLVQFSFASSDESIAVVEVVNAEEGAGRATAVVRGIGAGLASLTATGALDQKRITSEPAALTVRPAPPRVARVEISAPAASINRGGTTQLAATALDQNNQRVEGVSFNWTSGDANVLSVDANGLVRGVGPGAATITASAADGAGGFVTGNASLTVLVPLVINEILADVPPDNPVTTGITEGDANHDGTRSSDDDEFIELLNNSDAALDISGLRVFDSGSTSPRFTFPAGSTLAAGRALVIFGGGQPPTDASIFGGAMVLTVADSVTPSATLSLNDGGDSVTLKLAVGSNDVVIASLTYGTGGPISAPSDQSLTRAPDAEINSAGGTFIAHGSVSGAAGRVFSPGTRSDGTPFGSPPITRIEVSPVSARLDTGATTAFSARAYALGEGGAESEVTHVSFIWDSSDATKALVSPNVGPVINATAVAQGGVSIRARAGSQMGLGQLTVNPPPSVLTSVKLSPVSASITEGESTAFTAQALDQFGQPMRGLNLSFESGDVHIASVTSVSPDAETGVATATLTGHAPGLVQLIARATDAAMHTVASEPATLTVKPAPPVITRVEVTPSVQTIGAGQRQQFAAQALDQNGHSIAGVSFIWSSSRASVAVINQDGVATGLGAGTTEITAAAGNVVSEPAALTVTPPPIPSDGEVIINEAVVSFATSTTQARHDFLELYNRTNRTLDISGLTVSFRASGSSNTPATVSLPGAIGSGTTLIQPNGYFLIVNGAESFGAVADFDAPALDMNNTTGGIKLEIGGIKLDGLAYQGGSTAPGSPFNSYGEGATLVFTGGTTNDLLRSPNAADTGNNATDFRRNGTAASVTPKAANPTLP